MDNIETLRARVAAAMARADYGGARALAEQIKPSSPLEAAQIVASSYIEEQDIARARAAVGELAKFREDAYSLYLTARVLFLEQKYVTAIARLKTALELKGRCAAQVAENIYNLLGECQHELGEAAASVASFNRASELATDAGSKALEYSNMLFNSHYIAESPREHLSRALGYNELFRNYPQLLHRLTVAGERRLRIGYISPDMRRHVVACFSWAMLTAYDRDEFAVYIYANSPEDEVSAKIKSRVTAWRNIYGVDAGKVARTIYNDEIDILVDLAGHTRDNSLEVLAYKPAPLQLSGIGYFATTGLKTVDYFLGDSYLDDAAAETGFSEEMIRLPHSHFCYLPFSAAPLAAAIPARDSGYVTFGSFNHIAKVNDAVLAVWAEILRRVPHSRLLLKAAIANSAEGAEYTRSRLERAGIDLTRVELVPFTREYLADYARVDIALDTFPYPGGGTTCDALYMGVPVVTLKGATHGSRFGYSLLTNIGIGELVAADSADYIERAVMLASDLDLLAALHANLRTMLQQSPVMDSALYTRELASAYQAIWARYIASCAGVRLTYREARTLEPELASYLADGDYRQAVAVADRIMTSAPSDESMLAKCATAYLDGGDAARAERILARVERTPYLDYLLAVALLQLKRYEESERYARRALASNELTTTHTGMVHNLLAQLAIKEGRRDIAAQEFYLSSECKTIANGKLADYSNYLLNMHYYGESREKIYAAALAYGKLLADVAQFPHEQSRHRHAKIRVGYVSPDFRRHIVAYFSEAFFRARDRERFTTYAYYTGAADSETAVIAGLADNWRAVPGESYAAIAQRIYDDEIDILVDLSGHTGGSALPVLAYRPAPIQICGIGWFATTGLGTVDYFLTDKYAALAGEERYFTERLLRLPHSHLCFSSAPEFPLFTPPAPYRERGYITFGTLNQADKITVELLKLWREILERVPGSRLFIKNAAFDDEYQTQIFYNKLRAAGIDSARVATEGYTDSYFLAYGGIDIALDTYPYPGGGTTCDALYMGVPVVTLAGASHHQRFGASLLANIGLAAECVASTPAEYVERAVALATDRARLTRLHHGIRRRMLASAVTRDYLYMEDLEASYLRIYAEYKAADSGYELPQIEKVAPGSAIALLERARQCDKRAHWLEALELTEQALATGEATGDSYIELLTIRALEHSRLGDADASAEYLALVDLAPAAWMVYYSGYLMTQHTHEITAGELLRAARGYGERLARCQRYEHSRTPRHERIRVGYVSADFRSHVMLSFIKPFLLDYDRARFDVYAYSVTDKPDKYTAAFRELDISWRDMREGTYAEIARQIHADDIDILVDFGGHSGSNVLPALAYRPAPVQLSGLGYMGTTGLSTIDYLLTDGYVDPPGMSESYFTERLLRLPSQFCYLPEEEHAPATGTPALATGCIMFGVFNAYKKITDAMLANFHAIMERVPGSQILFKSQAYADPRLVDMFYERLAKIGFDMDRVLFEPATSNYMERYRAVDIALDTYPYPGGGTTCDALYMGVPVVTKYSSRHSTRFAYGILAVLGLEGLAVTTDADYVERAVALASDRELLDALHRTIRQMMQSSVLMQPDNYMRAVESAYQRIYRAWLDGTD